MLLIYRLNLLLYPSFPPSQERAGGGAAGGGGGGCLAAVVGGRPGCGTGGQGKGVIANSQGIYISSI